MPYSIVANSVIEIQALGRLHGQRTRTTFHYLYTGTTSLDGPATVDALGDEFITEIWGGILALQSNQWQFEGVQAQVIAPNRRRARFIPAGTAGGVSSPAVPSSMAVVLRRNGDLGGRRYQGRVYIPGIPTSYVEDSAIEQSFFQDWTDASAVLAEPLEGGTVNEAFIPIISVVGGGSEQDAVTGFSADRVLRTQRRRQLGVGE